METKQTAVQWLYDELSQCMHREEVCDLVYKLEQKAMAMEREQIIEAYVNIGFTSDYDYAIAMKKKAEQYYNETYGGQDE
jgi:hypothetical protein